MPSRRTLLLGLGTSTLLPALPWRAAAQEAPGDVALPYGWDPDIEGPTKASLYVAADGDDEADGSIDRPLRTIQRGVDLLAQRGSGSLAIRGGIYREAVRLNALRGAPEAGYRVHRYGRERVTISAAEIVTGWREPEQAEVASLGLPSGVMVTSLVQSQIAHGAIYALNLYEAGQWCALATDRADRSDPSLGGNEQTYYPADFRLDGQDIIHALRDPRLVGIDPASLRDARVRLYHRPNIVTVNDIADFDPATGIITLAERNRRVQRKGEVPVMLYALENVPAVLQPGEWAIRRTETGVDLYVLPRDPANLEGGIEVSLRPTCIDFGQARHVEIFGLEAIRAGGQSRQEGICIRAVAQGDGAGEGLIITHCRAGEAAHSGGRGYGAVHVSGATGLRISHLSIDSVRSNFGLFLLDSQSCDLRLLHVEGISNSPVRVFGVRDMVLAFSLFENTGYDAHANKFNFYEGCDQILVYGVRTRRTGGYATYQEASRIHFAFCELDCDPAAQNRALVSQNRAPGADQGGQDGSGEPVAGGVFYYWNNTFVPNPRDADKANSLTIGPGNSSQRHVVVNNVLHGGGLPDIYREGADPNLEVRSHNRYTGLAFWQSGRYGWRLGPDEAMSRINGRLDRSGLDMRAIIENDIAPLFPNFTDWDLDVDGRPVDWSRPPIGCRA